jgi:hypothetical protein
MTITDEHLSAFLDRELSQADMEAVRQQLILDEALSDRLAELAMVDIQVQQFSQQIDETPVPANIAQLLSQQTKSNVIELPLWRRVMPGMRQAAAVACIALLAGYGANELMSEQAADFAGVAHILDSKLSGQTWSSQDNAQVQPRLSFYDRQGDLCRQYQLIQDKQSSEHIACRRQDEWQVQVSMAKQPVQDSAQYITASGGSELDAVLDKIMAGSALTAIEESALFNQDKE